MERFSYTQQQLADSIGKSRSHIANTLRLLNLPEAVRLQIDQGRLTAGHARALVATDRPIDLAEQIIKLGLSVRETEGLARAAATPKKSKAPVTKDADTRSLEKSLAEALGLKVNITHRSNGSGTIDIAYGSLEQLEDVCRRLDRKPA
jgi:ParB family chromosome partitioning protein